MIEPYRSQTPDLAQRLSSLEAYVASRDPSFAVGSQGAASRGDRDAEVLSRIRSALSTTTGDESPANLLNRIRALAVSGDSTANGARDPPVPRPGQAYVQPAGPGSAPGQAYVRPARPGSAPGQAFSPGQASAPGNGAAGGGRYPPLPFPGTYPYSAERLAETGRPVPARAAAGNAPLISSMPSLRSV